MHRLTDEARVFADSASSRSHPDVRLVTISSPEGIPKAHLGEDPAAQKSVLLERIHRLEEENQSQAQELENCMNDDNDGVRVAQEESRRLYREIANKDMQIATLRLLLDELRSVMSPTHQTPEGPGEIRNDRLIEDHRPTTELQAMTDVLQEKVNGAKSRRAYHEAENRALQMSLSQLQKEYAAAKVSFHDQEVSSNNELRCAEGRARSLQESIEDLRKQITAMEPSAQHPAPLPNGTISAQDVDASLGEHANTLPDNGSAPPVGPSEVVRSSSARPCATTATDAPPRVEDPGSTLQQTLLSESPTTALQPARPKKNANRPAKIRSENTARNHCMRDWLQTHPGGTNGDFDAHWDNVRRDVKQLEIYQSLVSSTKTSDSRYASDSRPVKLRKENTARNHCMRDWVKEHPKGTKGEFDAHWALVRADPAAWKVYQDLAQVGRAAIA
ncbi:hypothetical protein FB107DRAFT_280424 [Schizophyllum commune]